MKGQIGSVLLSVLVTWLFPTSIRSQDTTEKGKVKIHLAEVQTPKDIKPGTRVRLLMVLGSVATKIGKGLSQSKSIADKAEVVSVKRPKNPGDPNRPVAVELLVPKSDLARIENAKSQTVGVVESKGGKFETKKQPLPLRLELLPIGKK